MDTFESNKLEFKSVASDRLFFDRWHYCIKIYLSEISAIRGLPDVETVDQNLVDREHWRQQVRLRWPGTKIIHGNDSITTEERENIKNFTKFLKSETRDFKIVISMSFAWIYTNDIGLIQDISNLPYIVTYRLSRAEVVKPRGVIALKNSPHTHRSYFRSMKLDAEQREKLRNFLSSQRDIRMSSALTEWLESPWFRTQDYFFVDHVNETWTLMMSLVCPRIIRKTLPIVTK